MFRLTLQHRSLLALVTLSLVIMTSIAQAQPVAVEPGVSQDLAIQRRALLSEINYRLRFEIPAQASESILARVQIDFQLADNSAALQLDFREDGDKIASVAVNGAPSAYRFEQEHVVIPAVELRKGQNQIEIYLTAGDSSLNRNPDFLYTLFVPDRARTAFPLFDQPDLKATWELTLVIPEHWEAIANAPLLEARDLGQRKALQFARSDLISSYLFSFVAGEFERVTRDVNGRSISMLHRESDAEKVERNIDAVFELHGAALEFLEDYTGIDYPFQKFDIALIPGFQYGGMEHVGAIQYRSDGIFLDESPSQSQQLSRASLIAHETAHMWFGDLVTMEWFNDVWLKEVFANFIAAKAVNPSFPEINHELGFLTRHYHSAYAVDRSEGANPIRQNLPNLNGAGSLYGNIIYNKAPVMMRQLEALVGEELFRDGLREYLRVYANSNATWPDLIAILDARTEADLQQWSEVWVNTPGRPRFELVSTNAGSTMLKQTDPAGMSRVWPQQFSVSLGIDSTRRELEVRSLQAETAVDLEQAGLLNADGLGYGLFPAQPEMLERWESLDEVERGSLLNTLYENLLEGRLTEEGLSEEGLSEEGLSEEGLSEGESLEPAGYVRELLDIAIAEDNQLLLNLALAQLENIYWSFVGVAERDVLGAVLEDGLWSAMESSSDSSQKKIYFDSFASVALTASALNRLHDIWGGTLVVEGLRLSENDFIDLAIGLAIKLPADAEAITTAQLARIDNADRRRRFEFIMPALSSDQQIRDDFFQSLADERNRAREPWVLDALRALHHPLRTGESEKYLLPSLQLLEEIQQTGDIFFPGRWLGVSLSNYRSESAVYTVRTFLAQRPDYDPQLRMKILQAADQLFRAHALLSVQ